MAAATGLVITKKMVYRDEQAEAWSNKYWLSGPVPSGPTAWRSLLDAMVLHEKTCYTPQVHVISAYGYADDTPGAISVWSVDLEAEGATVPGTLTAAQGIQYAGDQAGMIEWRTERKNTRGKWIYLRKYFHGGITHYTAPDEIAPETLAAYEAWAQMLVSVSPQLEDRYLRSQKQLEQFTETIASKWITTRTLKRRGKRP